MRAAQRITIKLVQEWIELFLEKNSDYSSHSMPGMPDGFENADVLGIPGQFAELWRKIWKLKKGMWDGQNLLGEQPREILMDLIGHCFLAIDMLDRAAEATKKPSSNTDDVPVRAVPTTPKPEERCGPVCHQGHTYTGSCKLRRNAGQKNA